jgi:putative salt-induced outer membrane protein
MRKDGLLKIFVVSGIFVFMIVGYSFAQEVDNVASVSVVEEKPVVVSYPWTGELFAGYTYVSGNTDKKAANFAMNLVKKLVKAEFSVKGNMNYSEANNKMDGQTWDGLVKYTHDFGVDDRWFSVYQVLVDHDYFSDVKYRITPSVGVGYHIARSEDFIWDVDAGLGYRITRHRVNTAADDEALTAIAHTFLKKRVFTKASLSEDVTVYPGLKADSGIVLRSETAFSNPLSAKLDLELKYIVDYNSQPATGKSTTDKKFVAGIKYKF